MVHHHLESYFRKFIGKQTSINRLKKLKEMVTRDKLDNGLRFRDHAKVLQDIELCILFVK